MSDLIERQAAIDAISCNITITGRQNAELVAQTIGRFADRIKALPGTQDNRPTGTWQITDAYPHNVYCSNCHTRFAQTHWTVWEDGSLPRNYCPNCGARMEEGERDG